MVIYQYGFLNFDKWTSVMELDNFRKKSKLGEKYTENLCKSFQTFL